jgi:predicted SAM-dependent methyltransferase
MAYEVQVDPQHYFQRSYLHGERWASYWHQIESVSRLSGDSVLEIGVGNGIVRDALVKIGYRVQTLDLDTELQPDHVGSVTEIPLPDCSCELVLAAEILEHIAWTDVPTALAEIHRVARNGAMISLPNAGYTFACEWKLPLIARQRWSWRLPRFWQRHHFDGEHYWEIGKRGHSLRQVREILRAAGFRLVASEHWPDDPGHNYFLLEKV